MLRSLIIAAAFMVSTANAETLAMDSVTPLQPQLSASPALLEEYGDDIRAEFNAYFDEAQTYLNCLAAASASAQAEVRLVLDAYREVFQRNDAQKMSVSTIYLT